ncbi:unnamed protein product [Phytophthora lilii]|uniref:Unnamed protein product n=1 Tax=Phytophthora lilii TaxID=2077276 RepID=A0A9W6X9Y6_9STRA|nr:unnamed protein product [Phytophthora lilii]
MASGVRAASRPRHADAGLGKKRRRRSADEDTGSVGGNAAREGEDAASEGGNENEAGPSNAAEPGNDDEDSD